MSIKFIKFKLEIMKKKYKRKRHKLLKQEEGPIVKGVNLYVLFKTIYTCKIRAIFCPKPYCDIQ